MIIVTTVTLKSGQRTLWRNVRHGGAIATKRAGEMTSSSKTKSATETKTTELCVN